MKAVILAGGKGTRMASRFGDLPKPMIMVGGIAVLEHQLRLLERYGCKGIIILTEHRSEVIEEHVSSRASAAGITVIREKNPLGTAGAVKAVQGALAGDFILIYGDVMMDLDLGRLVEFHRAGAAIATLVVHPNDHPFDSDLVECAADGSVTAFHPKPHDDGKFYPNLVSAGVCVLSGSILDHIADGNKLDFGRDVFPALLLSGGKICCYRTAEYLKDMGTPERLEEVERDWRTGKIARLSRAHRRKAVFLDRDGVIVRERGHISDPDMLELVPGAGAAIRKLNDSDYLAVVVTNQPVVARGECTLGGLSLIHNKLETLLGRERAKLDAIYFCPHHPDSGYPGEVVELKKRCQCRKPGTGMIRRAVEDFNIDLAASFIIGDSFRDIECGKSAGIRTIGVRTGADCMGGDARSVAVPDVMCDDISAAVEHVLRVR